LATKLKPSISNLSWSEVSLEEILPKLKEIGIQGIEVAPSALWGNFDKLTLSDLESAQKCLERSEMKVSGLQSLLYGHPEYQLFDRTKWPQMYVHLRKVIDVASHLESRVIVFGSPKNRVKGQISNEISNEIAAEFFSTIIPDLMKNNVVLTIEPNAADYGTDYLLNYNEVTRLTNLINSEVIKPQIDTGCLWMSGEKPEEDIFTQIPHHIHLSVPNLGEVPGDYSFIEPLNAAKKSGYVGWLVVEMLAGNRTGSSRALSSARWLIGEMEKINNG